MNMHAYEPEIIMAYRDGELPAAEAADVRAHVETCAACQELVGEFDQVSRQMQEWTVGPVSFVAPEIAVRGFRPWMWKSALGVMAVVAMGMIAVSYMLMSPKYEKLYAPVAQMMITPPPPPMGTPRGLGVGVAFQAESLPSQVRIGGLTETMGSITIEPIKRGPMIIKTASLALVTKNFGDLRSAVERLVAAQHGFIQKLETSGHDSPRSLSATLSVPSVRLDASLAELRKLGVVDQESQGGEEVTQQYTDLVARLNNARNEEKRLNQVLAERTGKIGDVLAVEKEISRVRGEIEQMSAEQRDIDKRVQFATITLRISEEYKAQVTTPSTPGAGTRLWNAMADGLRALREELLEDAESILRHGPIAAIWVLIFFWPVRWCWRKIVQSGAWSDLRSRFS